LGARAYLDHAGERELTALAAGGLDWEILVGLAMREGTAPLLYHLLLRLDLLHHHEFLHGRGQHLSHLVSCIRCMHRAMTHG